jgi:hypothetical protein
MTVLVLADALPPFECAVEDLIEGAFQAIAIRRVNRTIAPRRGTALDYGA